jgi:hypothetical protein
MKLQEAIDRPRQRWAEDGVVELTMGLQWFFTGAIFWFGQTLDHGSSFARFWAFAQSILWACVSLGGMWAIKRLKEQVIAPRAGYVALREPAVRVRVTSSGKAVSLPSRRILMTVIALACSVGVYLLVVNSGWWMENPRQWSWMIGPLFALAAAIYILWAVSRFDVPRYLWLAGLALILAVWLFWTRAPFERTTVVLAWLGGGLAVMGAIRLKSFLRENPRSENAE